MTRRAVVTGIGLISPLGAGRQAHQDGWASGRSFVGPITRLDPGPLPFRAAGEVREFKARDWVDNRKNLKLMTRPVRLGVAGAHMAMVDAGLPTGAQDPAPGEAGPIVDPIRFALFVGAPHAHGEAKDLLPALERSTASGEFDLVKFGAEGLPLVHPLWLLKGLSNNVLGFSSQRYKAMGPNSNLSGSGAGGAQAIGEGLRAIRDDRADIALCGGYDCLLTVEGLTGYGRLGLLTTQQDRPPEQACRPFDKARDGFAPAEGACFFVVEELEHARARGATVFGEIAGVGDGMDAHHPDSPHPEGRGLLSASRAALRSAGAGPDEVAMVVAHASGSVAFDPVEAVAIRSILGDARAEQVPVTAPKGAMGHTVAASGAFNAAAALLALQAGAVPPTANLEDPDPACRIRHVQGEPVPLANGRLALVHSAGLGGQATSLAIAAV